MMKRIVFIMSLLLASISALADSTLSYFSMGVNDTLMVPWEQLGKSMEVKVHANFNGYLDKWTLNMALPEGLSVVSAQAGPDMSVNYLDRTGAENTYNAVLTINLDGPFFSSSIPIQGYWDMHNNGTYINYGTVKWATGYYEDMFEVVLDISENFSGGLITLDGLVTSTQDWRGVQTINGMTYRQVCVIVEHRPCDVNGDNLLNISDVTDLIDYLLSGNASGISQTSSDVNQDGDINISDVTDLIDLLLTN